MRPKSRRDDPTKMRLWAGRTLLASHQSSHRTRANVRRGNGTQNTHRQIHHEESVVKQLEMNCATFNPQEDRQDVEEEEGPKAFALLA